jgi:hypothetical protein
VTPLVGVRGRVSGRVSDGVLLILGRSTIEKVLCRILHQDLGLTVCLVAASCRRLASIRIEPLNMSDPAHQATSLSRFRLEQKPIDAIGVWSWSTCHFFAHNFAAVQGLPGGPFGMDDDKIPSSLSPLSKIACGFGPVNAPAEAAEPEAPAAAAGHP